MGIREKIVNNPVFGYSIAAALLLFTVGMLTYQFKPAKHPDPFGSFYTDDDGKTYFHDSLYKFPPFDHNGKTAVMAFVYGSDQGNFVGFMERYTPAAKKKLDDAYAKVLAGKQEMYIVSMLLGSKEIMYGGMEYKLAVHDGVDHKLNGQSQWLPRTQTTHPDVKAPGGGECYIIQP